MIGPEHGGRWTASIAPKVFKHLAVGVRYAVVREFTDFDGGSHPAGETWWFRGHNFLPYDDGLSLFVFWTDSGGGTFACNGCRSSKAGLSTTWKAIFAPPEPTRRRGRPVAPALSPEEREQAPARAREGSLLVGRVRFNPPPCRPMTADYAALIRPTARGSLPCPTTPHACAFMSAISSAARA
jgi:hypothetical protein